MYEGATIVCCGTGPSISAEQVDIARERGWILFACNDAFRLAPDCALLHACNWQWWDIRWPEVKDLPCEKWTTRKEAAEKYGINWIDERLGQNMGLSVDPDYLHHGHGSGYQLLGMARHAGARRVLLLGYDMKYAPDYDAPGRYPGSTPRHFFGEYPAEIQHWPSRAVTAGVHTGMLGIYQDTADNLARTGPQQIINCTPGSALTMFPMMEISDVTRDSD